MKKDIDLLVGYDNDDVKDSDDRFRVLIEQGIDGIVILSADGVIMYASPSVTTILGYETSEMLERNIIDFGHPEDNVKVLAVMEKLLRNPGVTFPGHTGRMRHKDGTWRWIEANATNLLDNPAINGIVDNFRDVTAAVYESNEKKAIEKLLDNATTMARIGGFDADLVKDTLYWSPMTREIHEVDSTFRPHLKNGLTFFKTGESRENMSRALELAISEGKSWDFEVEIITGKGNSRWVRSIGEPEYQHGKCIRIFGSFQDIHSKKSAQLEVVRIANEKNHILESIGNGFFAIDHNWVITYWNKEAEKFVGKSRAQVLGKNLKEIYDRNAQEAFFAHYEKAIAENVTQHFEAWHSDLDKWIEVSAYPSEGGLSVYFKDITERKIADAERAALMSEIVHRNKDLEQFSFIVSHNLRSPVANIIGLAEELSTDTHSEEVVQILKKDLVLSVKRLDEVIHDLNSILQIKKGIPKQEETVCFEELMQNIKAEFLSVMQTENVTIATDFDVLQTVSPKSYLYSIFYNLILNSIKYRHSDRDLIIEISSKPTAAGFVLVFSDNGIGIDLTKRGDQVFGLYKRFHHHVDGKGIGLFMVKSQVEILGGTITVESEVNIGTKFQIEFSNK